MYEKLLNNRKASGSTDCSCATDCYPTPCHAVPVSPRHPETVLFESIATNDSGGYTASGLYIAKQEMYYSLINDDSVLLDSSSILTDFVDSTNSRRMGYLQQVDNYIEQGLEDTISGEDAATYFESAQLYNNFIAPGTNDVERTQITVNSILLNTYLAGIDTFRSGQIDTLWSIAMSCPSQYGMGVYGARALLGSILDSVIDYPDICNSSEEDRKEYVSPIISSSLRLFPNPADELINIEYSNGYNSKANSTLKISNALGNNMATINLSEGTGKISLSTINFAEGIYFVQWFDSFGKVHNDKFIITHNQ